MKTTFLSSKFYSEAESINYGDCILIDTGYELIIYDCGSQAHARRVLEYMSANGYSHVKIILSHNDKDHFAGIQTLIDSGKVTDIYTLLLYQHLDELLLLLDDDRITKTSLIRRISDAFDNISSLSKKAKLHDTIEKSVVGNGVSIVGPGKEYVLNAVAKLLDNGESDIIDNDTIANAVSCHVKVSFGSASLLLCGDSNYEAVKDIIKSYTAIQLPHHGKYEHASKIIDDVDSLRTSFYVSDNTGDSNGGSDELMKHRKGYRIFNTINGDLICSTNNINIQPRSSLGVLNYYEIFIKQRF